MQKATFHLLTALALLGISALTTNAQTFTTLYSFKGTPDGSAPRSVLLRDNAGNLYGTTQFGGTCTSCAEGGTVFKIDSSGNETVLHSFTGSPDGEDPQSGLIMDAKGNVYGTTLVGGSSGFGTVFKVSKNGKETVLYSFKGIPDDGRDPSAGLVMDNEGNLYGTTLGGGPIGAGTVFKLSKHGIETVLHSFMELDGESPFAGLIMDAAGNFYGTTESGGTGGGGNVFKIDASGNYTVLHNFMNLPDGRNPFAGLIMDDKGNLYGTTANGGDENCEDNGSLGGCGTVFKLSKNGEETVLHTFEGPDGSFPFAGLVRDALGNLYGITDGGGDLTCSPGFGCGVIFKLTTSGKETLLHTFKKPGGGSLSGMTLDNSGNLYGTSGGGSSGDGIVFKLKP